MRTAVVCGVLLTVGCGGNVTVEQSQDGSGGSSVGEAPGAAPGDLGGDGGKAEPKPEPLYCPQTTEGNLTTDDYDTTCLPCLLALNGGNECPPDDGSLGNFVGNLALCFGNSECCIKWEQDPLYEDAVEFIQCQACEACSDECAGEPLFNGYCD